MGQESMGDLLRQGIGAAQKGQRERARDLLMRVIERDEENVSAWLWLSGAVDGLADQEICLENVLALDPDNTHARKGLEWVRQQIADSEAPPPAPAPESPVVTRTKTPISPAAAMLRMGAVDHPTSPDQDSPAASASSISAMLHEEVESHQLPPAPEPLPPPVTTRSEFDNEYLCPYCAAPTEPDDRKCKACGQSLWTKSRRQEKRSKWLWMAMGLQLPGLLSAIGGLGLMLWYVAMQVGIADPFYLLHVYLGLSSNVPPDVAAAALDMFPRIYFFAALLPILASVTIFVGLYLRWRPVYYVYWISAVLGFVVSVLTMFLQREFGTIAGGVGVFFAFLMLLLVFRLEDDFKFEKRRMVLRLDRGLGNVADFLMQGDLYARQKMWAMAAIHLRQAAGLAPGRPDPRIALAVAYIRLKRYDRAVRELDEVDRIDPDNSRVGELRGLVDGLRSRDNLPI